MTTFAYPNLAYRASERQAPNGWTGKAVYRLRRSRSLASMLPALLFSGLMTLVAALAMHVMWGDIGAGFAGRWLESWLTAWPIAFPVAYFAGPALLRLSAEISAPASLPAARLPGLAFGDIADVSRRVTRYHGIAALRGLKPANRFSAV